MQKHQFFLLLCCNILFILHKGVDAGPMKRSSRMVREVYPEIEPDNEGSQAQVCIVGDVVYGAEEAVPADQPCLKCRCQPPGVQCEAIRCVKRPGCKALHRPNKCCPDYQCECEHEGRVYANGERLKTPLGGECKVCYCRGGEIQCAEVSCYIRSDCEAKTVPGQCCPKYDHCPPKEPLLERPMFVVNRSSSISDINKEPLELLPIGEILPNATTDDSNQIIVESTPDRDEEATTAVGTTKLDDRKQLEPPKITIQEIIPEIKEIPITPPSKTTDRPTPTKGQLIIIEEAKEVDSANDVVTDSEPESSEITEVFQQPPPVLRIGDKLLFLKQGALIPEKDASTPTSVITIIGAEGLQRGFEESAENHDSAPNELELKTADSTHILSLVRRKPTTTETPPTTTTTTADISTGTITELSNETPPPMPEETTTTTTTIKTSTEPLQAEQNPAYPPIPEIMSPAHEFDNATTKVADPKILPEVLPMRNNHSIPQNITNSEWLKNVGGSLVNSAAILPDEILNETAPSDLETFNDTATELSSTTIEIDNTTTTTPARSTETIEDEEQIDDDSGEATTPKNHESIHSSNASAAAVSIELGSGNYYESIDMLHEMTETNSMKTKIDDVEVITSDPTQNLTSIESSTTNNPMLKDVETIRPVDIIMGKKKPPSPEKKVHLDLPPKTVLKRENSARDEADEVFKQLNDELIAETTERIQTKEQEQAESDRIFKELLEETVTPKTKTEARSHEEMLLQRVSDALAKLTLRSKKTPLDSGILGILSDFFSSQYKYYEGRE